MLRVDVNTRSSVTNRYIDGPKLLHQLFELQASQHGEKSAIEFGDEVVTYDELEQHANQIAHCLASRGVRPADLVGIYLKKSPRLFAVILGILKAGAGYVPIDPKFPHERIATIAEDAELRFIVSEGELGLSLVQSTNLPVFCLDEQRMEISRHPVTKPVHLNGTLTSSHLSYVIYTSGSTGRPKGVMIEHRNALEFAKTLQTVYRIGPEDRVYQGFSTAFDASVEEIWAAFSRGGTLVVPTEEVARSPADIADFINRNEVTYFSTVPTVLAMIDCELPTVTTLVLGGEVCTNELVSRWAQPGRRMLNTYGPTETTVVATWSECVAGEPVTIGRALPGYETYVLDENLAPVAPGVAGELYIGGAGVGRGYMNLQELTNERFIPNPFTQDDRQRLYRTFDEVVEGDGGDLMFIGRLDGQIKIRGFRIELSEIEAVLVEHPAIRAAAVGITEVSQMKELAAYVVCHSNQTLDRQSVADLLRRRLPSYMVPQFLDAVSDLPTMPSGKIDRKSLPAPQSLLHGPGEIVDAGDELERIIRDAWKVAFHIKDISVESDFFLDLGGHSLLAAQAVNIMRGSLSDVMVSVRDIYEMRTIRAIAAEVRRRRLSIEDQTSPLNDNQATNAAPEPAPAPAHPLMRWATYATQAVVGCLIYGIYAAPLAFVTIMVLAVLDGKMAWVNAATIATAVGFAAWPAMIVLSIAVKWIVIGRFKPGRYPLWGSYYLRWWIVSRVGALSWSQMFAGSPLMSLYWRAMGARVGESVTLCTPYCTAYDMISIGDHSSVGLESQLLGYRVENGYLVIAPTEIGKNCYVGMHCNLGLNTRMRDGSRLGDLSQLPDGAEIAVNQSQSGSPARPSIVEVPTGSATKPNILRRTSYGVLHLGLIYVMGYLLVAASLPTIAMIAAGLFYFGPTGGAGAAIAAVPFGFATYLAIVILVCRALRSKSREPMDIHSARYLKHWFQAYLLENTKTILAPIYATVYFPAVLRALGAKVGRGAEISTVSHFTPELLEIGDGSFLADACLIGGQKVNQGTVEIGTVRIGSKSFIGNSALIPGGRSIGDNTLIGVASVPPMDMQTTPDDTRWLGSPSFRLPRTAETQCYSAEATYTPTKAALVERTITDTLRILLPGLIVAANGIAFVAVVAAAYHAWPLASVVAMIPLLATALAVLSVFATTVVKALALGWLSPTVKPLWSRFVWRNELVNGVYESVAAPAMTPMMGTPFIAPCLRMMGCRVGKGCFIETTLFSEFDLVVIGDRASLNLGATIQTHLFEDRVFKADYLKLGDECTVGNMSLVLYSTTMHQRSFLAPLSVLMKGEELPADTRWQGIPCQKISVEARDPRPILAFPQSQNAPTNCANLTAKMVA